MSGDGFVLIFMWNEIDFWRCYLETLYMMRHPGGGVFVLYNTNPPHSWREEAHTYAYQNIFHFIYLFLKCIDFFKKHIFLRLFENDPRRHAECKLWLYELIKKSIDTVPPRIKCFDANTIIITYQYIQWT